jgi:beta-N-acetylhexosaminidase
MTAHVAYPAVDPSGVPATLSPILLQQLLRDEMGFRGVVCSDSLLMAGVRDRFATEEEMAVAVISAGVDLLLDFDEPAKVIDYLCDAVEQGNLDAQRVDEAFERVWALKQKVFANLRGGRTTEETSSQSAVDLAARIARDAIELVGGTLSPALPLKPDVPLVAILLKPFETPLDPPEQPLAAALRERFRKVQYVQLGPNAEPEAFDNARKIAEGAQQLLVAMIVRPAAWHAFELRPPQRELAGQLARQPGVVLASLGVPYVLQDYPDAAARICTYSDVPLSQQALAEFLLRHLN